MPNVEIVAIGSELLLGQIVDTNSAWMAQRFTNLGLNLFYKTVVGDNPGRMKEVIGRALERSDIVITSGGLGPTQDDLTREIVAEVAGRRLVFDPSLMQQIEEIFRKRGRSMTSNNRRQAYIPEGAIPVRNQTARPPLSSSKIRAALFFPCRAFRSSSRGYLKMKSSPTYGANSLSIKSSRTGSSKLSASARVPSTIGSDI
jgi:molybdenum cofactor synthesis domain-containing protein